MGIQRRKFVHVISALAVAALAAKPLINPVPLLIWNASESVPIGWYFVAKRQPKLGKSPSSGPRMGSKSTHLCGAICHANPASETCFAAH